MTSADDKGYIEYTAIEVHSTNPCPANAPATFPDLRTQTQNRRRAELAVAVLAFNGLFTIDYGDDESLKARRLAVESIAAAFNAMEMKV